MAFPQVQTVAHSQQTSDTTSHTVTLPSGIASGDLLLCLFSANGHGYTTTFPAGWTQKAGSGANNVTCVWGYRVADGGEGSSISITTSASENSASTVYRITGHNSSTNAPESKSYWNSGTDSSPNPDNLTPTGGAKDYLWFYACGADSGYVISALPSGMTNLQTSDSGSTAGTSVAMSTGREELNASSLNVPAGTLEGAEGYLAITVVVHPGSEGGGGGGGTGLDPFGMSGFFGA